MVTFETQIMPWEMQQNLITASANEWRGMQASRGELTELSRDRVSWLSRRGGATMLTQLPHEGGFVLATKIEHFVRRTTLAFCWWVLWRHRWRVRYDSFQDGRVGSCTERSSSPVTSATTMQLWEFYSVHFLEKFIFLKMLRVVCAPNTSANH